MFHQQLNAQHESHNSRSGRRAKLLAPSFWSGYWLPKLLYRCLEVYVPKIFSSHTVLSTKHSWLVGGTQADRLLIAWPKARNSKKNFRAWRSVSRDLQEQKLDIVVVNKPFVVVVVFIVPRFWTKHVKYWYILLAGPGVSFGVWLLAVAVPCNKTLKGCWTILYIY